MILQKRNPYFLVLVCYSGEQYLKVYRWDTTYNKIYLYSPCINLKEKWGGGGEVRQGYMLCHKATGQSENQTDTTFVSLHEEIA